MKSAEHADSKEIGSVFDPGPDLEENHWEKAIEGTKSSPNRRVPGKQE